MSQVTIIADDSLVYVDGRAFAINLSSLDPTIHVVQWNGATGWVEYRPAQDGSRPLNSQFSDFSQYQRFVDAWNTAFAASQIPPPPPTPIKPTTLTRRQVLMVLMIHGFITTDEAVAAAGTGAIPAIVATYINALPADQQPTAKITWAAMTVAHRSDAMLNALAVANEVTPAQLDAFFVEGQSL